MKRIVKPLLFAILAFALPVTVNAQMGNTVQDTMNTNHPPQLGGMAPHTINPVPDMGGMSSTNSTPMGNMAPNTMNPTPKMGGMSSGGMSTTNSAPMGNMAPAMSATNMANMGPK